MRAELADDEWGFVFEFVDPATGRVQNGFAYLERQRPFAAAKGNNEQYEWRKNSPFLLVVAPGLPLGTGSQPWWSRTIVTLNYAITLSN